MKPTRTASRVTPSLAALVAWIALPRAAVASRAKKDAAAPSANADLYPKLPAVSAMMGAASETLKNVNSQAGVLEARVAQAQLEDEAKLARQKVVFEQKLKAQEQKNEQEVRANAEISHEIETLKANNTELRKRAEELQDGNRLKRNELHVLQSRLGTAQDFAVVALKSSDDSEAPELDVLRPASLAVAHKARHHHEQTESSAEGDESHSHSEEGKEDADDQGSEEEEDDDSQGSGAAFISLAARVRRMGASRAAGSAAAAVAMDTDLPGVDAAEAANPGDLLAVLSKGVTDLQREAKESEAKLKSMFLASFRAGTKRHAALVAQQSSLNSTRSSLQALRSQLEAADRRLKATSKNLDRRLRGLGFFAQKLAHLALAPAPEAPHLLEALPKEVVVPTE